MTPAVSVVVATYNYGRYLAGALESALGEMFLDNFICFSSVVVRRDVFEGVGVFDESLALAIDYDLWLRAATRYSFDYVAAPLVKYRVGHPNLSSRVEERLLTVLRIM